jgi:hypothetical protein
VLGLDTDIARFRKGAVAALSFGAKGALPWTLEWVISPGREKKSAL